MAIKGCTSVSEYKAERKRVVELWFSSNFEPGFCSYEISGNFVIVRDLTGDSLKIFLDDISRGVV